MSDKNINSKKDPLKKTTPEIVVLIEKKLLFFQDVIQKTILHVQKNKILDIIGVSEVNSCINTLFELSKKIKDINDVSIKSNTDNIINILQLVNNELSSLFKLFGTDSFEDLLWICFGNNSVSTYAISDMDKHKFELLKKYFHPTSYKLLGTKKSENDKLTKSDDCLLNEKSKNLDSTDISIKIKPFHLKVYGIQLIIHNPQHKKSLIITGTVDDIMIDFLNNKYVNLKYQSIKDNIPQSQEFQGDTFTRFIQSLNLKDYLILEPHEIYSKYAGYLSNLNILRQKTITQVVKDFIGSELFIKRNTIMQLLVKIDKYDNQYLAYLLYDLLSNDTNGIIDTQEQTILFDSFPWSIKQYFKDAMKSTVQYTNDLSNFDIQKIPLEQQICLLKVSDSVKEKAMQKLKEIKAKSEDSGSKARQYLDGLLKIPFNIYRKEPILNIMSEIKLQFTNMLQIHNITNNSIKDNYTSLEILNALKNIKKDQSKETNIISLINNKIESMSCNELKLQIYPINEAIQKKKLETKKLKLNNRNMKERQNDILEFVKENQTNKKLLTELFNIHEKTNCNTISNNNLQVLSTEIESKYGEINSYMTNVKFTLDKAVHGHDKAKKQIERIIGQWINGSQDGYCFGFEGPAGVGKTTLAKKGLADCLKDEKGISRPFAMIQMGGDSNGSSLHGHNYTYVGSTWGSIVQILIDKKCMNPIIFIDEIDKISKTEHGKEIVGILTHLLDPAQNDGFYR
jgi:ATP-dependent Lon protease